MHISTGTDPREQKGNRGTVHVQRTETGMWWTNRRSGELASVLTTESHVQSNRLMWHSSHCFYYSGNVASNRSHQVQAS